MPAETYRDEAAVKVEAFAAAFGHHDTGAEGPVHTSCQGKEQHVEAHVGGQVAVVVVPVGRGQLARTVSGRPGGARSQPVGSTVREGSTQKAAVWRGPPESEPRDPIPSAAH